MGGHTMRSSFTCYAVLCILYIASSKSESNHDVRPVVDSNPDAWDEASHSGGALLSTELAIGNCKPTGSIFCGRLQVHIKEALSGPFAKYWHEDFCSGSTSKTCPSECSKSCWGESQKKKVSKPGGECTPTNKIFCTVLKKRIQHAKKGPYAQYWFEDFCSVTSWKTCPAECKEKCHDTVEQLVSKQEKETSLVSTGTNEEKCEPTGSIFCGRLKLHIKDALQSEYAKYWQEDYCSGSTSKTCPSECSEECWGVRKKEQPQPKGECTPTDAIFCSVLKKRVTSAMKGPYAQYWYEDFCSGSTSKTCPAECNGGCYPNDPEA